jgi:hypothetical protein
MVLLLAAASSVDAEPSAVSRARTLLVSGGALTSVAASRLLAPGAALAAVHRAAAPWWLAPTGRLLGAQLLVVPLLLIVATALLAPMGAGPGPLRVAAAALVFSSALGALVCALTPHTGASAAGALGLLASFFGLARPSEVSLLFDNLPLLQRPLVLAWNVLPLPWRAALWLDTGSWHHAAWFGCWVIVGIAAAGWVAALPWRRGATGSQP